jgi:hypothetical protein
MGIGAWGLGVGGLGVGGWGPTPNPPIPNPQSPIPINKYNFSSNIIIKINKLRKIYIKNMKF